MTTERTPQDVLRELRRELEKLMDRPDPFKPASPYNVAMYDVFEVLDKAIAEAPDSPRLVTGDVWEPGGQAATIYARAKAFVDDGGLDTLSEKPGLADLDWLMGRVVARFSDSEYHRAKDIILRMAGFPTARALKETVRSGSTDSEGR